MAAKPASFYVSAGLLYPSALGAAFAWLAPAVVDTVRSHEAAQWWRIVFAAWFVLYHALWFVHLAQAAEHEKFVYKSWSFASDLVDVIAVFAAFLALGLAWPAEPPCVPLVYVAAILIPFSAMVDRKFRPQGEASVLLGLAGIIPLVAIFAIPRSTPTRPEPWDWAPLAALYVLLGIYIAKPSAFGSHRADRLQ
jgi:hypothetical protein